MFLLVGKVAGFSLSFVLARLLGADDLGVYFLGVSFAMAASVVARLGLDQSALRFAAVYVQRGDLRRARSVVRDSAVLITGASVVAYLLLVSVSPWIANHLFSEPHLTPVLRVMASAVIFIAWLELATNALKAVDRPVLSTGLRTAGLSVISLLFVVPATQSLGLAGAAWVFVGAYALLSTLGFALFVNTTRQRYGEISVANVFRFDPVPLLDVGLPLLLVASMNVVIQWTDTVMLGAFATAEAVGLYNVAQRFAVLLTLVNAAVVPTVVPKFSRLHAVGDTESLERLARRATGTISLLTLPAMACLFLFARPLLLMFGAEFAHARTALLLLATGQFINAATGPVGMLLAMTGNHHALRRNTQLGVAANVSLNAVLIPIWGLNGAAAATAISIAFKNIRAIYVAERALGISLRKWLK